jgi:hypothetical protein
MYVCATSLQIVEDPTDRPIPDEDETKVRPTIPYKLQIGISGRQFVALHKHIDTTGRSKTRKDQTVMRNTLDGWLTEPFAKGLGKGDLNKVDPRWRGEEDGAILWGILMELDAKSKEIVDGVPHVLVTFQRYVSAEGKLMCHMRAEGARMKEECFKPFRDMLKDKLEFCWGTTQFCWTKQLPGTSSGKKSFTKAKSFNEEITKIEKDLKSAAKAFIGDTNDGDEKDLANKLRLKFQNVGEWPSLN